MYICRITTCHKKFNGRNSRANTYCSPECYNIAQRNGDYRKGRKSVPCRRCSKPVFYIYEKDREGNPRTEFLCKDCHLKTLTEQRGNCAHCKEPIPAGKNKNKYCSSECKAESKRTQPRNCTECDAWFTPIRFLRKSSGELKCVRRGRQMQCSSECAKKAQFNNERNKKISEAPQGERHHAWRGGTSRYRGENWNVQREFALQRDSFLCVKCGANDSKENPLQTFSGSI